MWNCDWEYENQETLKQWYQKDLKQRRLEKRQNRICRGCGKTFTSKRSDAVYCSNACRQRTYRRSVMDKVSVQIEHLQ